MALPLPASPAPPFSPVHKMASERSAEWVWFPGGPAPRTLLQWESLVSMATEGGGSQLAEGATTAGISQLRVNPVGNGLPLVISGDGKSRRRNQEAVPEAQQCPGKEGWT